VEGILFTGTCCGSRCEIIVIAKHCELMSICLVYYWKREVYPLEKERRFSIPTGEAELTPICSRSAKRSNALFFKVVVASYVHGSVHRESMSIIVQQDANIYSLLYFCKLLYMFRVVTPPIIRSTYNCDYSIWHWSNRLCYLPLS
jgi:hypothetical protein